MATPSCFLLLCIQSQLLYVNICYTITVRTRVIQTEQKLLISSARKLINNEKDQGFLFSYFLSAFVPVTKKEKVVSKLNFTNCISFYVTTKTNTKSVLLLYSSKYRASVFGLESMVSY